MCLKYRQRMTLLLILDLFPKLSEMCPKEF